MGRGRSWGPLRYALPLVILAAGMIAASRIALHIRDARSADLQQDLSVIQTAERALSDIKDAETGQRGFLLTGREAYLVPYEGGRAALQSDLARLKREVAAQGRPEAVRILERAERVSESKIAELARTIDLARSGRRAEALALVETGQGKATMDEARSEFGRLLALEHEAYEGHGQSSRLASKWADRGILLMGLALVGVLTLSEIRRGRSLEFLRQANQRFERLAEATQEGVILVEDGRFLDVNEAYARMFGYRVEELIGRPVTELADPAWKPGIEARHRAHVSDPYEVPCIRKDGSRFMVWSTSREVSAGDRIIRISIVRDLTEERARAAERQRLLDLLDAAPDLIAIREVVPSQGGRLRLVYWNKAMYRLHGVEPGSPVPDLPFSADRPAWAAEKLEFVGIPFAAAHGLWDGETAYFDAAGREIPTLQHIFPMRNEEGRVTHFASVARDIREQKQMEKAKRDFVAMSNHELRTPLTALLGAIKLLGSGLGGSFNEAGDNLLKIATGNGERLLRLLNDLLDLDKLGSHTMSVSCTVVDLDKVLERALALHQEYARPFGVDLALGRDAPGLRVMADEHRLMQVLGNLLSNAAKFSPRGSTVRIGATGGAEEVVVSVSDAGPGIPESFRPRIFQSFEQAEETRQLHSGGTGLGLAVTKLLVERMGGRIWFDTAEGRGTTFYVALKRESMGSA